MAGAELADPTYWAISDAALRTLLRRAHAGEDPDLLALELYANSETADEG